jgi:oligosaccharyltransferase complex subunit alpha (ribophorin I)
VVGEWSRFDLMTRPAEFGRASIPAVQAVLPPSAHSLYFRDSIGNISSSETRAGLEAVAVQLQPRYPLFGGWSNRFLFGWTLPLADVVAKVGGSGGWGLQNAAGGCRVQLGFRVGA